MRWCGGRGESQEVLLEGGGRGKETTASASESEAEDTEDASEEDSIISVEKEARAIATRFADHGILDGPLSHDGSPHVTDEVFNAASHLVAGMLSVLGAAVLITGASAHGDPWAITAFSLYSGSLLFLFFSSFAHHGIKGSPRLMEILRRLDYVAIFFLIPGTMTPVCFVCLTGTWVGWVFFGAVWGLSLLGVVMVTSCPIELPMWASMTMYITLGWFGAFLAVPAYQCLGLEGSSLLGLGGVVYTGGGVVFTLQRPNPLPGRFGFHEIWHLCVMTGAALHWAMVFFYVWPAMCKESCES